MRSLSRGRLALALRRFADRIDPPSEAEAALRAEYKRLLFARPFPKPLPDVSVEPGAILLPFTTPAPLPDRGAPGEFPRLWVPPDEESA